MARSMNASKSAVLHDNEACENPLPHIDDLKTFPLRLVPVERPQDLAKAGSGTIKLLDRYGDPLRITGLDTKFTKELMVGDQISLPKDVGISAVVEIISDTELIVKKEFKELKALELLTSADGSKYKCMPHMDQTNVYKTVFERLNAGHCVGIFPEGGSHDRAEMLPLKGMPLFLLFVTVDD